MRVLISGSSGLIGSALTAALRERGDEVIRLVRPQTQRSSDEIVIEWDTEAGFIDQEALAAENLDAVIHLAGESLMGRWSDEKKKRIRSSRIESTKTLISALKELKTRPKTLISASAVGFYGNRDVELLTESSKQGKGFLANVVAEWEENVFEAETLGLRTVVLRMGAVQSAQSGALKEQLTPFKLGLGAVVGSGQQWWPWIGLNEVVRVYLTALEDARYSGVINAVGPTPVTGEEYAKVLGRKLHRPVFLRIPGFVVKWRFGELADELLLSSQKVVPTRLEGLDFDFSERTINDVFEGIFRKN